MTAYVALLRGVNLVGKFTLKMADLKAIACDLKLDNARTYIASGWRRSSRRTWARTCA